MFKRFFGVFVGLVLLIAAGTASAAAIVNPLTGQNGRFSWTGGSPGTGLMHPIYSIDHDSSNTFWEVTVGSDSTIDVTLNDGYIPGDAFALYLNSTLVAPTTQSGGGGVGGTIFTAFFDDIFLSAGTHRFDVFITESCCNNGVAFYDFSAVSAAVSDVPSPAPMGILALGLIGVGFAMRRRARG